MGQQRKRPAPGVPSNRPKQAKISENDVTHNEDVQPTTNDLFTDVDDEMLVDANHDTEDQSGFADNDKLIEDEQEETQSKSLLDAPDVAKRFRDFYISQLTQAFPNDLDKIRQEENFDHRKLEILIDSLEAGVDIFSDMEKNFAVMSS